jgi:hypothetical protein
VISCRHHQPTCSPHTQELILETIRQFTGILAQSNEDGFRPWVVGLYNLLTSPSASVVPAENEDQEAPKKMSTLMLARNLIMLEQFMPTGRDNVLGKLHQEGLSIPLIEEIHSTFSKIDFEKFTRLTYLASQIADTDRAHQVMRDMVTGRATPLHGAPESAPHVILSPGIDPQRLDMGEFPMTPPSVKQRTPLSAATPDEAKNRGNDIMEGIADRLILNLQSVLEAQILRDARRLPGATTSHETKTMTPVLTQPQATGDNTRTIMNIIKITPKPVFDAGLSLGMNLVVITDYIVQIFNDDLDTPILLRSWNLIFTAVMTFIKGSPTLADAWKDQTLKKHTEGITLLQLLAKVVLLGEGNGLMRRERNFAVTQYRNDSKGNFKDTYQVLLQFRTCCEGYVLLLKIMAAEQIVGTPKALTGADTDRTWMLDHVKEHVLGPSTHAIVQLQFPAIPGVTDIDLWTTRILNWLRELAHLQPGDGSSQEVGHGALMRTQQSYGKKNNDSNGWNQRNTQQGHGGNQAKQTCNQWSQRGSCSWGSNCRFTHDPGSERQGDGQQFGRKDRYRASSGENHRDRSRRRDNSRSPRHRRDRRSPRQGDRSPDRRNDRHRGRDRSGANFDAPRTADRAPEPRAAVPNSRDAPARGSHSRPDPDQGNRDHPPARASDSPAQVLRGAGAVHESRIPLVPGAAEAAGRH